MLMLLVLLQCASTELTRYYAVTTAESHVRGHFDWDDLEEFAADCREAHAAAPAHPWPLLASASAAISAGEFGKAVRVLDAMTLPPRGRFAAPCPVAAARYALRGAALEYQGHLAEALMAYREAVACDGSFRPARLRLGRAAFDAGDYATALAQFGAMLERDRRDADALAGRGAARWARSREVEAKFEAGAAFATSQSRPEFIAASRFDSAPVAGGVVVPPVSRLPWAEDRDGARIDLGAAILLDPDNRAARECRAELRYHERDYAGAEADYLAALGHSPSPRALAGVALARLAGGDAEGAGRAAALGLVLTDDVLARGYLHLVRGEVAKLRGDDDGHRAALGQALEECPSDPELARHCRAGLGR